MEHDSIALLLDSNNRHGKEIATICEPMKNHLVISYVSYMRIQANGEMIMLNNNHNWLKYYFNNNYYKYDHHVVAPKNIFSGSVLWTAGKDDKYRGRLLFDAVELFNLNCGMSIIRSYSDYYEVFSFNGYRGKYQLYTDYLNHGFCFERFADYFKNKAANLINKAPVVNMLELKPNFATQQGIMQDLPKPPPIPEVSNKLVEHA